MVDGTLQGTYARSTQGIVCAVDSAYIVCAVGGAAPPPRHHCNTLYALLTARRRCRRRGAARRRQRGVISLQRIAAMYHCKALYAWSTAYCKALHAQSTAHTLYARSAAQLPPPRHHCDTLYALLTARRRCRRRGAARRRQRGDVLLRRITATYRCNVSLQRIAARYCMNGRRRIARQGYCIGIVCTVDGNVSLQCITAMYHCKVLYAWSMAHCKAMYARVLYARSTQGGRGGTARSPRIQSIECATAHSTHVSVDSAGIPAARRRGGRRRLVGAGDESATGNLERQQSSVGVEQLDTVCPEVLSSWTPYLLCDLPTMIVGITRKLSTHFRTETVHFAGGSACDPPRILLCRELRFQVDQILLQFTAILLSIRL